MRTYYATFGCKVNQCETENIRQRLSQLNFVETDKIEEAELCIVNSCTVTAQSDLKCRQFMHKVKKVNPCCAILLRGCMPQALQDVAKSLFDKRQCDIVVGNKSLEETIASAVSYRKNRERAFTISKHEMGENFDSFQNGEFTQKTRAYVKIQDGCDQYCSYCIIPFARGHMRSRKLIEIRSEIERLSQSGHKEIILVGINLCCYGKDFDDGTRLIDAIETACSVTGIERVRLGSIEPEMLLDSDIDRMAKLENLCPQFHLSLQSGCDKTLKAMNRKYSVSEYAELCQKLRTAFPDCSITTDIMVGFPGETEEDFDESLRFVERIGFAQAHIFPYSQRIGTAAAGRAMQIEKAEKKRRAEKMLSVCNESSKDFLTKMVGKTVKVLFEKENCTTFHQGYSENYTLVKIHRENVQKSLRRKSFYVIIEEVADGYCIGRITD